MEASELSTVSDDLDSIRRSDEETEYEFWFARDLMPALGYTNWESFAKVVEKAQESCRLAGLPEDNHFRQATKMVAIGSGASRPIEDIMLSRFASYLVAQNGDSKKTQVAVAQAYFAVQTRKMELIEDHIRTVERLEYREQLRLSEKALSDVFAGHGIKGEAFGIIRSKGDRAFFGGQTTQQMKTRYGISKSRPLGDFLPSLTLSAKTLINEMSKYNIDRESLQGESAVTKEHVNNSTTVRDMLGQRGITPEDLPAEEDITKIERKHKQAQDNLKKSSLPALDQ
ncbi:DNA damage-inducible protein D [Arthrobacter flavus]|uniref:DNA damage-inducible protein D n=1 Tax=Arthrobacter flavus TaxID=95172 RepID=A0ABW4Q299_9MICC